ncbi:hypothetical protein O5343_27435, partial [Escherichia coli]|nr:hypothetical protein [Escherichia coli]
QIAQMTQQVEDWGRAYKGEIFALLGASGCGRYLRAFKEDTGTADSRKPNKPVRKTDARRKNLYW